MTPDSFAASKGQTVIPQLELPTPAATDNLATSLPSAPANPDHIGGNSEIAGDSDAVTIARIAAWRDVTVAKIEMRSAVRVALWKATGPALTALAACVALGLLLLLLAHLGVAPSDLVHFVTTVAASALAPHE